MNGIKESYSTFYFLILSIQTYVKATLFLQLKETTTESILLSIQYILVLTAQREGNTSTLQGRNGYLLSAFLGYESLSVIGHGLITATVGFLVALQFALASDFASDLMESLVMESSFSYILTSSFPVLCSLFL